MKVAGMHIITDSYARFLQPTQLIDAPLTILPNRFQVDGRWQREHAGQPVVALLKRMKEAQSPPQLHPPSSEDYAQLFTRLGMEHETILSIHASAEVSPTLAHAREAARVLHGHCHIELFDSQNISVMQGMLVEAAIAACRGQTDIADLVPALRGMTHRIYSVFLVEDLSTLQRNGYLSLAHQILSEMHDLRVVVSMEGGALHLIEKARTRAAGIERLVEFVLEFEELECGYILQAQPGHTETTRILRERLAQEYPGAQFGQLIYGASLAAHIGTEATGIALLEREPNGAEPGMGGS
ncbi:MAG: DegV family EDD domain-containing protein [Chloroflexi bacterium]|nr:DegV family EDD domain-containing protein [Chloroflexota bacterium]